MLHYIPGKKRKYLKYLLLFPAHFQIQCDPKKMLSSEIFKERSGNEY